MSRLLLSLVATCAWVSAFAEPVTPERLAELLPAEQPAWRSYLERSRTNASADAAAIAGEVRALGLTDALRAPNGGDFKRSFKAGDPWYAGAEAKRLADAILSYQTPTGGWSKHTGYAQGPRRPGMQWTSQNEPGKKPHYVATFDNHSTTEQMRFLAHVAQATGREDCKAGFVRGLEFILAAQFPSGGWPQVYPLEGGYHDHITLNDDAMTHVLELLQDIVAGDSGHAFLAAAQLERAAAALASGLRCVLRMQVEVAGRKTVWCGQHDALTLKPAPARKMEPATLSGSESAQLVKFLMTLPNPSSELVASIESALAWLEAARITGLRRTQMDGKTRFVSDPASPEIYWARFYDLSTGQPVFPGRDGVLYTTFDAMAANNSLGYDYYSTQPGSILTNGQKKWRKLLEQRAAK